MYTCVVTTEWWWLLGDKQCRSFCMSHMLYYKVLLLDNILLFPNCSIKYIIHSHMPWTVRAKMSLEFEGDKCQWKEWFKKSSMLQNEKHFMGINLMIRNFNLVFQNKSEYGTQFQICQQMLQIFHSISYRQKKIHLLDISELNFRTGFIDIRILLPLSQINTPSSRGQFFLNITLKCFA